MRLPCLLVLLIGGSQCCPTKEFLSCVVQVNAQKVPFDLNITQVVFNITTEAKLIHTCKTYEKVFPCFDQRLGSCGTKTQKALLEKAKRVHSFMCAPFSLQRQNIFLNRSVCVSTILDDPMATVCDKHKGKFTEKLASCRSKCKNLVCLTRIDAAEQNVCVYQSIEKHCGTEGAQFYAQLQQVITSREYPVSCDYIPPPFNITTSYRKSTLAPKKTGFPNEPVDPVAKKEYYSTSYVQIDPNHTTYSTNASSTLRRQDPRLSISRSRNFGNMFAPMKPYTSSVSNIGSSVYQPPSTTMSTVKFVWTTAPSPTVFTTKAKPIITTTMRTTSKPIAQTPPVSMSTRQFTQKIAPITTKFASVTTSTIKPTQFIQNFVTTLAPVTWKIIPQAVSTTTFKPMVTIIKAEMPQILHGARPIPESSMYIPTQQPIGFKPNPFAKPISIIPAVSTTPTGPTTHKTTVAPQHQWRPHPTVSPSTAKTNPPTASTNKWIPWYHKSTDLTSPNPLLVPFYDSGKTLHPTLMPPVSTNIFSKNIIQQDAPRVDLQALQVTPGFRFIFQEEPIVTTTTPSPFKININWMDDPQSNVPWYQQTGPMIREIATTPPQSPFAAVQPLINHLKNQPLNLTELGNQANSYFSAAWNAFNSASQNAQNDPTRSNDPWRSLIDAVAPTIQKVSPDIIPRIRQEMERLEQK